MSNEKIIWSPESLRAIIYTPEQQTAIDEAIAETSNTYDGFVSYTWSDNIVQRGAQTFAVFGSDARELVRFTELEDDGTRFEYLPVVVDNRMLEESPDEGRSGVLYLMRRTHCRGQPALSNWISSFLSTLSTGWLRTEELTMTNGEIVERIADEIDAGQNVLTDKPAGWA